MEQPLLERLTEQCRGDRALAINILRKRGHMHKDSEELTTEGTERDKLGAEGRALDRHVQKYGGHELDYDYDQETNRVRKRA